MNTKLIPTFAVLLITACDSNTMPSKDLKNTVNIETKSGNLNEVFAYSDESLKYTELNIELLKAVEKQLLLEDLPVADKFTGIGNIANNLAEKIGKTKLKLAGPYPGKLLYKSNGTDYKIIISNNGDCFIVRAIAPKMIDPTRSMGPIDCDAYGVWSPDGKDF